jgi:hypothetical protein
MPAKAGIQASGKVLASLDSRFRGNDDVGGWRGFFHKLFRGNDERGRFAGMAANGPEYRAVGMSAYRTKSGHDG